jgi:hypothetical protein
MRTVSHLTQTVNQQAPVHAEHRPHAPATRTHLLRLTSAIVLSHCTTERVLPRPAHLADVPPQRRNNYQSLLSRVEWTTGTRPASEN